MAIFHIKVNVTPSTSSYCQGDGAVLLTVVTGTTSSACSAGITGYTSNYHQITGKTGTTDYWISTGPSSAYCVVSCSKPGFSYSTSSVVQVTTANTPTLSVTLVPSTTMMQKYLTERFVSAINSTTLTPQFLKANIGNTDFHTSSNSMKYYASSRLNSTSNTKLISYGRNGSLDNTTRYVCGAGATWVPDLPKVGSIYDYDPTPPPGEYGPPYTVSLATSLNSISVANNSNTDITFTLTLQIKPYQTSSYQTIAVISGYIAKNSSNSFSMTGVLRNTTNVGGLAYTMNMNGVYTSYLITLSGSQTMTASYYTDATEREISISDRNVNVITISAISLLFTSS